jgi:PAS domain S-box-containing protein
MRQVYAATPSRPAIVTDSTIARLAPGTGWVLVSIAFIVLSGWVCNSAVLVSLVPSLPAMMPNTAVAFLLAGLALLRREYRDLLFYSMAVLAIGTLTAIEYLAHLDFGIDELLFRDPYFAVFPGRMAVNTSVAFILLGSALALMKAKSETARRLSRGLAIGVGSIGVIALLGYGYNALTLYQLPPFRGMALPTALAFVVAAIGVHCANPAEGLVRQLCADRAGGTMLRRLLPAALLIPCLLTFTILLAHKRFGWEMGFSLALVAASIMFCLAVFMVLNAKRLDRDDFVIRESEERFRLVANTAPVMIWMSAPDKQCTYVNQPWLEFTGRPLEKELGSGWAEGIHADDFSSCMETYAGAFDRRKPFQMQYRLRRHDGEYRWILDIGMPRFREDGFFIGYIGSCIDVTDRKLVEQAHTELGGMLIRAQEEERIWIAKELHEDINQRMAALALELDCTAQDLPDSPSVARNGIARALNGLTGIITAIQSLSYRLHSSHLEYLGLAVAAENLCAELSERQKVQIDFHQAGIPLNLSKDISLCLFRVLQESLHNAVKHSGARNFRVDLCGNSDEVRLVVRDKGVGFDQEAALKRRTLGLISMRERLQLVNGDFSIKSQPGGGTTIDARVRLREETSPPTVSPGAWQPESKLSNHDGFLGSQEAPSPAVPSQPVRS